MLIPIGNMIGAVPGLAGNSLKGSISEQSVKGLLLYFQTPLTVTKLQIACALRMEGQTDEQLIQTMQLLPLVERAELYQGTSYSAEFEKQAFDTDVKNVAGSVVPQFAALLDLGNIIVGGMDELSIILTSTTTFAAGDGVSAWFVDGGYQTEEIKIIKEDPSGNAIFQSADEVYVYRTSGSDADDDDLSELTAGQLNIQVKSGSKTFSTDALGFFALTCAVGNFGMTGPRRTILVYNDRLVTNPGGNVVVTLTGTDAANYSCFGVMRYSNAARAHGKRIEVVNHYANLSAKLEQSNPAQAMTLKLQGKLASSADLRTQVAGLRQIKPTAS